jgi:hypothetical protein
MMQAGELGYANNCQQCQNSQKIQIEIQSAQRCSLLTMDIRESSFQFSLLAILALLAIALHLNSEGRVA